MNCNENEEIGRLERFRAFWDDCAGCFCTIHRYLFWCWLLFPNKVRGFSPLPLSAGDDQFFAAVKILHRKQVYMPFALGSKLSNPHGVNHRGWIPCRQFQSWEKFRFYTCHRGRSPYSREKVPIVCIKEETRPPFLKGGLTYTWEQSRNVHNLGKYGKLI